MGTSELEQGTGRELMSGHLWHISLESLAVVLDSEVGVAEPARAFRNRIFWIPDHGAFVNLLDHLDMDELRSAEAEIDAI